MTTNDDGQGSKGFRYDKQADIDARRMRRVETPEGFIAELLLAGHVPSLSPNMGIFLVEDHLKAVENITEKMADPDSRAELLAVQVVLREYIQAVRLIVTVAAHHQRGVIDGLQSRLRKDAADSLGLEDPDHLETAEALLKLAHLGPKAPQ